MRNHPVLTAVALLAIGTLVPASGSAQGSPSPSPEQIVKSLTPDQHIGTRTWHPGRTGSPTGQGGSFSKPDRPVRHPDRQS